MRHIAPGPSLFHLTGARYASLADPHTWRAACLLTTGDDCIMELRLGAMAQEIMQPSTLVTPPNSPYFHTSLLLRATTPFLAPFHPCIHINGSSSTCRSPPTTATNSAHLVPTRRFPRRIYNSDRPASATQNTRRPPTPPPCTICNHPQTTACNASQPPSLSSSVAPRRVVRYQYGKLHDSTASLNLPSIDTFNRIAVSTSLDALLRSDVVFRHHQSAISASCSLSTAHRGPSSPVQRARTHGVTSKLDLNNYLNSTKLARAFFDGRLQLRFSGSSRPMLRSIADYSLTRSHQ